MEDAGPERCMRRPQRERGEIWLLDRPSGEFHAYEEQPGGAPRLDAIEACIEERLPPGVRGDAPLLWIERMDPCIDACMRERGWRPVPNRLEEEEECADPPTAS